MLGLLRAIGEQALYTGQAGAWHLGASTHVKIEVYLRLPF